MIYPPFLKSGSKIGVTAPSSGIAQEDREYFERSLEKIRREGYNVTLTDNVYRCDGIASTDANSRAEQLTGLLKDKSVDMIWASCGGDMLVQMLPHLDYRDFSNNPKWIMGYSDITGLVFPVTVKCDIATLYGPNAGSFDSADLHTAQKNVFRILSGDIPVQNSYPRYERKRDDSIDGYNLDSDTAWISPSGDFSVSGRLIGGCLDCLQTLTGTPYGDVAPMLEKYASDGFIWYLDIFALSSTATYYALWNMAEAGWFKYAKGIMVSRVCFPSTEYDLSYEEAVRSALGDIPIVLETEVGHVKPQFTLVNGSLATLTVKGKGGSLEQKLV